MNFYPIVFQVGIYCLLIIIAFYSSLEVLMYMLSNEDFNYGYIIPLVVLYLMWENKDKLLQIASKPTWTGLLPIAVGVLIFWLGELGGEFYSTYLSLWFMILGLCLLHLGWEKLKTILFPVLFILTIFPPPQFIYKNASIKLKLISSEIGVSILQFLGISAYREGNIIDLGFTQLQVVDACNGLRYLIPLIILGILLSYFYKSSWWKKVVLVLTTIPISILLNGIRIASVGVLYPVWGPEVAEGFFHDFSGWLLFMISLFILLFEMWILKKVFPEPLRPEKKDLEKKHSDAPIENLNMEIHSTPLSTNRSVFYQLFQPAQFIVAVFIILSTIIISQAVEFREKIPISKSFDQFPLRIEDWTGTRRDMEQKFIDTLDLSDYVIIDYKNTDGKDVNFYVAYYESQSKGESIHSPETCLPGSGWIFQNQGSMRIPIAGKADKTMPVNRAVMEKSGYRQLVYYWFPQRGRILTNAYQLKLYTFWDALTRQRTDGALVRLVTMVYPNEEVSDAEKRMQEFTQEVVPVLNEFLPGK